MSTFSPNDHSVDGSKPSPKEPAFRVKSKEEVESLCRQHVGRALAVSQSVCKKLGLDGWSGGEAEDALHDALVRVLKANQSGKLPDQTEEFLPFLLVVIRNVCIDRYRQKRKLPANSDQLEQTVEWRTSEHENTNAVETAINTALDTLPENWKEALKLKVEQQMSYQQIAVKLGCTHQQVRTWIFRGRQLLQKQLDWNEISGGNFLERRSK